LAASKRTIDRIGGNIMAGIFDFDGDGNTSFEENLFGTMLVMGAFDERPADEDCADSDEDDDF